MPGMPRHPEEERHEGRYYGKYRAFVRDNCDPERLGRCRLEIPGVLGEGEDNWSEWAWPSFPVGGNPDTGSFLVPDEGSGVWAEFEEGDPQYPIWTGVWLAMSNPGEMPKEAERLCPVATCLDCPDKARAQSNRATDQEHKPFHGHPPYACPRRRVIYKSETGHTIVCDDKDGEEFFRLIDRAGQILEMSAPVKPSVQKGNAKARGDRRATAGDQLSFVDMVEGKAHVEIMDLARQSLRFEAYQNAERVILRSCDPARSRVQEIILDTTTGAEKITLRDSNGNTVTLDATGIRLADCNGSTVSMAGGSISIQAAGNVNIN